LQKIWNWFGNNVAKKNQPGERAPKKGKKKDYSVRDVVKTTHRGRILKLISEQTQAPVGDKDWLKYYPAALTKVMEALNDDEITVAQAIAKEWKEDGIPKAVKRE
jgi:hypothetical protein